MPLPLTTRYLLLQQIQIGFTFLVLPFWYRLTRVVLDKIQKNCKTIACVCVCRVYVKNGQPGVDIPVAPSQTWLRVTWRIPHDDSPPLSPYVQPVPSNVASSPVHVVAAPAAAAVLHAVSTKHSTSRLWFWLMKKRIRLTVTLEYVQYPSWRFCTSLPDDV